MHCAHCEIGVEAQDVVGGTGPPGKCGACHAALYDSVACQRADWPRHRAVCAALARVTRHSRAEMEEAYRVPTVEARVAKLDDGDTLRIDRPLVAGQKKSASIRFDGVDAPEIWHPSFKLPDGSTHEGQPLGDDAALFIATLAPLGATVRLAPKPSTRADRYGRSVADLWIEQPGDSSWVWLQEALLESGYAHRYADYDKKAYLDGGAERARVQHLDYSAERAKSGRLGVWRALACGFDPMVPHAWRHNTPEARAFQLAQWRAAAACLDSESPSPKKKS